MQFPPGLISTNKRGHKIIDRVGQNLLSCTHLRHHPTLSEDHDMVGKSKGFINIVGYKHNGLGEFSLQPI